MSTVKASWSQLPVQGSVLDAVTNLSGDRFATSTQDGSSAYVQIWEPDVNPGGDWLLVSQVSVPKPVTKLTWAHPESGLLLAGSTAQGNVVVLEAPRPFSKQPVNNPDSMDTEREGGEEDEEEDREWQVTSELQGGTAPIRQLLFAPRQYGLLLSAASEDGHVYIWEADRPLAPNSWCLQGKIQAASPKSGSGSSCGVASMAWRGFNPGVAPLLAVGTASALDVWQYVAQFMTWQRVATLPLSTASTTTPAAPCAAVHWAPSLGRPLDLVAAAHGSSVDVFSLQGDSSAPQAQLLATLAHDAVVHQVEWNMLGTCLGSATATNRLYVWKPDFVGEWQLVSVVQGVADVGGGEESDG